MNNVSRTASCKRTYVCGTATYDAQPTQPTGRSLTQLQCDTIWWIVVVVPSACLHDGCLFPRAIPYLQPCLLAPSAVMRSTCRCRGVNKHATTAAGRPRRIGIVRTTCVCLDFHLSIPRKRHLSQYVIVHELFCMFLSLFVWDFSQLLLVHCSKFRHATKFQDQPATEERSQMKALIVRAFVCRCTQDSSMAPR